jgi:energy-converting hydrogenase Eha subunit E
MSIVAGSFPIVVGTAADTVADNKKDTAGRMLTLFAKTVVVVVVGHSNWC